MSSVRQQPSTLFTFCPQVDAIAFHAYSTNASDLITYANTLHDTYNMDVWITEFADQVAAHLS
jgi:hypothetical protein